jgi:hypothetical protein
MTVGEFIFPTVSTARADCGATALASRARGVSGESRYIGGTMSPLDYRVYGQIAAEYTIPISLLVVCLCCLPRLPFY